MGTRVRIATVCQGGRFFPTVRENIDHVMSLLDRALREGPDLVCLPETFPDPGTGFPPEETAEPLDGPILDAFARKAREARCYVVCPIHTREGGRLYNSAVVLDRAGQVAGVYHKACPVTLSADYTSLENGITPGDEIPIFDLDFGPVAVQICFDLGFPENWRSLAERGARLVLWPSAYDGGFPLRAYAYLHHFYVVSATRTGASRIIDPCGEVLEETSGDSPVAVREINLDYVVAHWDWNMGIPDRIRDAYGDRVEVRQWDPGSAHFVVEPKDPSITCAMLREEFGFESTGEYHDRHRRAYERARRGEAPPPQTARHGCRPQYSK